MTTQYLQLLGAIKAFGNMKGDRTGTGTQSLFGEQIRFDLNDGFPLLTTKKLTFRWIVEELLWFLSGSTDVKVLQNKKITIWDEWATKEQCARFGREEGDLGPVYGHQWRNFGATEYADTLGEDRSGYRSDGVDQIAEVVKLLVENPNSRRILLTGWNPKEATTVALPPCHCLVQFETHIGDVTCPTCNGHGSVDTEDKKMLMACPECPRDEGEPLGCGVVQKRKLSAQLYQRSCDVFLGVPYNIASYALLTHMLAHVCGFEVGDFIHTFGDVHIYNTHREQVDLQLTRDVRPLPKLRFLFDRAALGDPADSRIALRQLLDIVYKDMKLEGYKPHPKIKAEVSV